MGGLLFFLLMVSLFALALRYFNDYLSPSVEMLAMYTIAAFCYVLVARSWRVDLNLGTVILIVTTLAIFMLGEIFSKKVNLGLSRIQGIQATATMDSLQDYNCCYYIKPAIFLTLIVIASVTLYLRYQYTLELSIAAGNKWGISKMMNFVYYARYHLTDMPDEPSYVTFGCVITQCFAYFSLFIFLANQNVKIIKRILYIIPVVLYSCQAFLGSGRTWILRLLVMFLIIYMSILYRRNGRGTTANIKIIKKAIIAAVIFVFAYRAYGIVRGSYSTDFTIILSYPASPIQALNMFLENPTYSTSFGEETLITIKSILNKLGFEFTVDSVALPYVSWTNYTTNIYSSIRRYIADYGYFFTFLIQFFLGFFYGSLKKALDTTNSISFVVFYCAISYPIVECLFEERFLLGVVSAGTVYLFICLPVIAQMIHVKEI